MPAWTETLHKTTQSKDNMIQNSFMTIVLCFFSLEIGMNLYNVFYFLQMCTNVWKNHKKS